MSVMLVQLLLTRTKLLSKYGRSLIQEYRQCGSLLRRVHFRYMNEKSSELFCSSLSVTPVMCRQFTPRKSLGEPSLKLRQHVRSDDDNSSTDVKSSQEKTRRVISRKKITAVPENDRYVSSSDYLNEKDHALQVAMLLQKLLDISYDEAKNLVKINEEFAVLDLAEIRLNYKKCLKIGLSKNSIAENPWIISYSNKILMGKIKLILTIDMLNIEDAIPLFRLNINQLLLLYRKIRDDISKHNGINRITYLSEELQCSKREICKILVKYYFMQELSLERMKRIVNITKRFNVSEKDLLRDIWTFNYSSKTIVERLQRVTDAGVFPIKTWMVRCQESVLEKRIEKEFTRRSILGKNGTSVEYLSEKLGCNEKEVNVIASRYPEIWTVSGPKMKRFVDFIIENGFTKQHVIETPWVMFRSVETMQKRLEELTDYKYKPHTLSVLTNCTSRYEEFLNQIKLKSLKKK